MSRVWLNNYRDALERIREEDKGIPFVPLVMEAETPEDIFEEVRHDINYGGRELGGWD